MKEYSVSHSDPGAVWDNPVVVKNYIEIIRGGIPFSAYQLEMMLFLLKNSGQGIKRFLDLGCGNGILSDALLMDFPRAEGVLLDRSEVFLKEASEQLKEHSENIELVHADLMSRRWLESVVHKAKYDAVICGYTLSYLTRERKKALLKEIFAILQPGGLFICIDSVTSASLWVKSVADTFGADHMIVHSKNRGIEINYLGMKTAMKHRNVRLNVSESIEQQLQWLREDGYAEVDCVFKTFESAVFCGRKPKENILQKLFKIAGGG